MPVYKYRCQRYMFRFERKHFIQVSKVRCPKCQGEVKRIIFPTPKGGGFSTTYRG